MRRIDRGDGVELAYEHVEGRGPALVFLPGYGSDMTGDKATMLAGFAAGLGCEVLQLDYSGHGASGGAFTDGTIGRWADDALVLIDRVVRNRVVLVGSSMGGWIALLVGLARPERVAGLVGIAAAPDFTKTLVDEGMTPAERAALARDGIVRRPSEYGGEQIFTRALIEEGHRHLLLDAPIDIKSPVRLLQGMRDSAVPWQTALRIAERLRSDDVRVTFVKDGEHRLSRPQDLAVLRETVGALLGP